MAADPPHRASSPGAEPGSAADVDSMLSGGHRVSAYRTLLRSRNYRLWFFSALGSGLGDWTGLVALQVLVTSLSERGSRLALFALGGIMMARLLPSLIVGPVAGVLADRYDRKRLMVVTNLARGVLFSAVAFSTDIVAVFALTFVIETLSLLFLSAKDASLPVIVRKDHLTQANQLNLLVTYGTLPMGALFATAMIPIAAALRGVGIEGANATVLALLVNAVTFVVSALLLSRLVLPAHGRRAAPGDSPGMVAELKEGLRFIHRLPLIRSLILGVVGVFFGAGVIITLGPVFVGSSLGGADTDWFTLMAFVGVGLVGGILAVPLVVKRIRKERIFPIALAATGGIAAVMATLPNLAVTLGFGFALGAAAGLSFVVGYTLLHAYTPDDVRARTFATFYTGTRIAMFAALGIAPFLAGVVGAGSITIGNATVQMSGVRLVILLGGLVALFSATIAGRGMYRALREQPDRAVRLPASPAPDTGGLFIAFEGVEGSGKSTQVRRLVETLETEGREVVVTREPGGTPVAERIRGVLLDPNSDAMDARTEALLYAAARAEHVSKVIQPALARGAVVICDRFVDSSLAYQGYGRELGEPDVFEINRWAIGGLLPDVVVLLHLDPDEGLRRIAERARRRSPRRLVDAEWGEGWERGEVADRLEREDAGFHRRVGEGFLKLAKKDRGRFCIVDATADAGTVAGQVRSQLHAWLPLPTGHRDEPTQRRRPQAAG
ncbi:hypothetical protein BH20ACT8_BH20ACT8_04500 [soil metagenome]